MSTLQQEIISFLKVKSEIDPFQEIRTRVNFLKSYLLKNHLSGYVLGISGGQDSTLAGRLAQIAVDELNDEYAEIINYDLKYKFIAVRLPYGVQFDEDDAQLAIKFIGASKLRTVNIKAAVDASVASHEPWGEFITDFLKGNIKARERMKLQYDIAGANNLAVIGTDHAAESVTGFYTKHGDGACDIAPLYGLNKRQGRQMLKAMDCPARLYEKAPTADLEDDKPGLLDEEALGIPYVLIDDYLEGKRVPESVRIRIESAYIKTMHKRHGPVTIYDDWWK